MDLSGPPEIIETNKKKKMAAKINSKIKLKKITVKISAKSQHLREKENKNTLFSQT